MAYSSLDKEHTTDWSCSAREVASAKQLLQASTTAGQ